MNIVAEVARIIDRHEWSRLDGGSYGQQIASDLAAKGLLRTQEEPAALHQLTPGSVILMHHIDVVPEVLIPKLYEISNAEELDDGDIEIRGHILGGNGDGRILVGPANMIVRKVVG